MILALLLLLTGLTISAVAIYYSVLGLAAIFAAATIPIYIMGGTLEIAKLVAASWLKANWHRATGFIKYYMTVAVAVLMLITSMGIFGFLSKAHLDQAIPTGDVAAQVALIDEKIKTQRDNIETARAALTQMDAQVNQRLSGRNADQSAERSVQIRRQQASERNKLQAEIATAQKAIAKLNEERAPIASQLRKVEAEVGPIKYIAQFVYGQEADQNLLEKAVTWVIILIVIVFDPLAVAMLLAAQQTFSWYRKDQEEQVNAINDASDDTVNNSDQGTDTRDDRSDTFVDDVIAEPTEPEVSTYEEAEIKPIEETVAVVTEVPPVEEFDAKKHPYLFKGGFWDKPEGWVSVGPMVYRPEPVVEETTPVVEETTPVVEEPAVEEVTEELIRPGDYLIEEEVVTADTTEVTVNETVEQPTPGFVPAEESTYQILPELIEESSKKKIHDQAAGSSSSKDQEITYIQNGEQNESSLWNRVRSRVSEEFKPKDFLTVVYAQGNFEDFQYDPIFEPELDKFIKDIKNDTHRFSDYPQEQLAIFASRIYELRKN